MVSFTLYAVKFLLIYRHLQNTYRFKRVYYIKNKLQNVDVYRSDGIISYTNSEVKSDKKLANYLEIPLVRNVVISNDKLLDNNTLFSYEAKGDSIFVNQAKNLVIYVNFIQK